MQPEELAERIAAHTAPMIIDVCTGLEFKAGHIHGALHAPTLKILLGKAPLPKAKETEMVALCGLGPRAMMGKGLLLAPGYSKVGLLSGHMAGWRWANRPIVPEAR